MMLPITAALKSYPRIKYPDILGLNTPASRSKASRVVGSPPFEDKSRYSVSCVGGLT